MATLKLSETIRIEATVERGIQTSTTLDGVEMVCTPKTSEYIDIAAYSGKKCFGHTENPQVTTIGKLGFRPATLVKIQDFVNELTAAATSDAWTELRDAELAKAVLTNSETLRGVGWCDKCGSYCFGDCETE